MRTWFPLHSSFLKRQRQGIWWRVFQIGKSGCTQNGKKKKTAAGQTFLLCNCQSEYVSVQQTAAAFYIQMIHCNHPYGWKNCQTIFQGRNSNWWNCLAIASCCLYLDHISQLDEKINTFSCSPTPVGVQSIHFADVIDFDTRITSAIYRLFSVYTLLNCS